MTTTPDAAKATTSMWRMEQDNWSAIDVELCSDGEISIRQGDSEIFTQCGQALQLCHNLMAAAALAKEQDTE